MKQTLHLMAKALRDVAEACPESAAVQSIIASLPSEVLLIGDSGLPPRAPPARGRAVQITDKRPEPGRGNSGGGSRPWSETSSSSGSGADTHSAGAAGAGPRAGQGREGPAKAEAAAAAAASLIANSKTTARVRRRSRGLVGGNDELTRSAEGIGGELSAGGGRSQRRVGVARRVTGAGGSASASSSADWDSATWQSYRLADLPDDAAPRGQGGGQGRGLPGAAEQRQFGDFPNRPPRVRALSAPALPSPDPRPAAAPSCGGRYAAFASESPELHAAHMQGAAAAAQADGLGMPFASPSLMSDTGSETSEPPKPYSGRALPSPSSPRVVRSLLP